MTSSVIRVLLDDGCHPIPDDTGAVPILRALVFAKGGIRGIYLSRLIQFGRENY